MAYFNAKANLKRQEVFKDTMSRIEADSELKESVKHSIETQRFIAENSSVGGFTRGLTKETTVIVSKNRTFEAARPYALKGKKVAVLNFASATTPGGGVVKGSSAQEESLCRVSTLYPCINDNKMWKLFYTPHRNEGNSLHNDDIIYTKDVMVIKDDDYNLLSKPFKVDVITCAAPNLRENPTNRYNAYDGDSVNISNDELYELHVKRAKRILDVARYNQVDVVILGAFGCGAFRNSPDVVAEAYLDVLSESYRHDFETIEFAIYCRPDSPENYNTFKMVFDDKTFKH